MASRALPPALPGTWLGGNLREFRQDMLAFYVRLARNVHADMTQLTLEIIARTLFDADVRTDARDAGAALHEAQENFLARFQSILPMPEWVPTPGNLRLRRAIRKLDALIYRFIEERRSSKEERNDLLSLLLRACDEDGSRMTDQ